MPVGAARELNPRPMNKGYPALAPTKSRLRSHLRGSLDSGPGDAQDASVRGDGLPGAAQAARRASLLRSQGGRPADPRASRLRCGHTLPRARTDERALILREGVGDLKDRAPPGAVVSIPSISDLNSTPLAVPGQHVDDVEGLPGERDSRWSPHKLREQKPPPLIQRLSTSACPPPTTTISNTNVHHVTNGRSDRDQLNVAQAEPARQSIPGRHVPAINANVHGQRLGSLSRHRSPVPSPRTVAGTCQGARQRHRGATPSARAAP